MDRKDQAFLKRLLATFRMEAEEHVQALSSGLIELEATGAAAGAARRQQVVEGIFREIHSFKGAARAVGKGDIESLCQGGEEVFAALKAGGIEPDAPLLDLLHGMVDLLAGLVHSLDREPERGGRAAVAEMRRRLDAAVLRSGSAAGSASSPVTEAALATPAEVLGAGDAPPQREPSTVEAAGSSPMPDAVPQTRPPVTANAPPPTDAVAPAPERRAAVEPASTVRLPVHRLDALLFQAESLLGAKLDVQQRGSELRAAQCALAARQRARARISADIRLLQRGLERGGEGDRADAAALRRALDYLTGEETFLKGFGGRLGALSKAAERDGRSLRSRVDGLLDDVKRALMLPIASILEGFPKLVRDLSRDQGKEVDFRSSGGEVEIDRRILEEMHDPLIHLLRNSVDHGIEMPEVRVAAGKPRRGSLRVDVAQMEGGRIEIRVADDGAGVDLAGLRAAARKLGLATADSADDALLPLMFQSGVSTSALVNDISGRGLGLAIVHEKVERLGGTIGVDASPGAGTTFRLILPLTLATFHGVRVKAAGEEFIVPTMVLERVLRVRPEDVVSLENRESIRIAGQAVALVRLADVLQLEGAVRRAAAGPAVVAGSGERRVAFLVDEVIGEQEVLVKGLGRQLRRVRNIAGATVLGSGRVVPILHVPDLLKSVRRLTKSAPPPDGVGEARERSILVADDSITSRMLLKGILESAGYRVSTAVDGADAYARLCGEHFDMLVSDVDMPGMSGLELTARVRANDVLARLPVVLVSTLGSREDRARGAEVGASAYLVKSSMDQSNLLTVVRRFL